MSEERGTYNPNYRVLGYVDKTCVACGKSQKRHWAAVRCFYCNGRLTVLEKGSDEIQTSRG